MTFRFLVDLNQSTEKDGEPGTFTYNSQRANAHKSAKKMDRKVLKTSNPVCTMLLVLKDEFRKKKKGFLCRFLLVVLGTQGIVVK